MKTEYRIIVTTTFNTVEERTKAYSALKSVIMDTISKNAIFDGAVMTTDEYQVQENTTTTERII